MSTSTEAPRFDAYYKWLGIPKREQPANHYRLLGLSPFEADPQTILAAAEKRLAQVAQRAESKHAEIAARLADEIQFARECLLNAESKTAYDEVLKQQSAKPSRQDHRAKYTLMAEASEADVAAMAALPSLPEPVMPVPQPAELEFAPDVEIRAKVTKTPTPVIMAAPQQVSSQGLALAAEPIHAPAPAPVQAAPEPIEEPDLVELADDLPLRESARPSTRIVANPAPPMPPVNGGSGGLLKLIAAACFVGGGVTVGLLMWNRHATEQRASASAKPAPAETARQAPLAVKPLDPQSLAIEVTPATQPAIASAIAQLKEEARQAAEKTPAARTPRRRPRDEAPRAQTPTIAEPAAPTADPEPIAAAVVEEAEPEIVYPFATARTFRSAWQMAGNIKVEYLPDVAGALVEGEEQLGGFLYRKPWRQATVTIHAQTITGRLELIVNGVTLKFETATAVVRRPAQVVITQDPLAREVTVAVGSRRIASAAITSEDFGEKLDCELRCEGGAARLQVSDLQVRTR